MEILYNDSEIVVCIKPSGILSEADISKKENMVNTLSKLCNSEIFPLHRLDREVSGVMVYAKSKSSAAALSKDIANNQFKKEYFAITHGVTQNKCGEMRDLLFKDSSKNKSYVVKRERKGVKKALLEYEILDSYLIESERLTLFKVLLHTGRTHQIRVQFASRKLPLIGDRKYGSKDNFSKIGLWSHKLTFNHPKTKEKLTFTYNPENEINKLLNN